MTPPVERDALTYFVPKDALQEGSTLYRDPPWPSCDVVLSRDYDALAARVQTLTEALVSMVYVHPCQCGDGVPEGQCARCRAVRKLGFDPALVRRKASSERGEGERA